MTLLIPILNDGKPRSFDDLRDEILQRLVPRVYPMVGRRNICGGLSQLARDLGIGRATLYRHLARLKLGPYEVEI